MQGVVNVARKLDQLAEAASRRLDELWANNHEDQSGRTGTTEPHMHTESDPEPAPFAIVVDNSEAQQYIPLADQVTTTTAATHTPPPTHAINNQHMVA
jgi:hypothetical protein